MSCEKEYGKFFLLKSKKWEAHSTQLATTHAQRSFYGHHQFIKCIRPCKCKAERIIIFCLQWPAESTVPLLRATKVQMVKIWLFKANCNELLLRRIYENNHMKNRLQVYLRVKTISWVQKSHYQSLIISISCIFMTINHQSIYIYIMLHGQKDKCTCKG